MSQWIVLHCATARIQALLRYAVDDLRTRSPLLLKEIIEKDASYIQGCPVPEIGVQYASQGSSRPAAAAVAIAYLPRFQPRL